MRPSEFACGVVPTTRGQAPIERLRFPLVTSIVWKENLWAIKVNETKPEIDSYTSKSNR